MQLPAGLPLEVKLGVLCGLLANLTAHIRHLDPPAVEQALNDAYELAAAVRREYTEDLAIDLDQPAVHEIARELQAFRQKLIDDAVSAPADLHLTQQQLWDLYDTY